ncbi:MAG TPA: hypothetical protein VF092_11420 [Longimicrobium sp.]
MRKRLIVVLLLLGACTSIPLPRLGQSQSPALERKLVTAKREPNQLLAADGSSCLTTAKRYSRTQRGQRVWCVWRRGA